MAMRDPPSPAGRAAISSALTRMAMGDWLASSLDNVYLPEPFGPAKTVSMGVLCQL